MKRLVLFLAVAILSGLGLQSCDREENNGGTTVKWVDLGLPSGLLWADRNVGAQKTEDYGNYYAWGETSPKGVYDWTTYIYGNAEEHALTKYCCHPNYGLDGYIDNLITLEASDDAASVNLGGNARMPSFYEWHELIENTTRTWTTRKGVYGLLLTASNGKSLFLPAAGSRFNSFHSYDLDDSYLYGCYWSNMLDNVGAGEAWVFNLDSDCMGAVGPGGRCDGFSVRAVRADKK